jgi:hypothetical protein
MTSAPSMGDSGSGQRWGGGVAGRRHGQGPEHRPRRATLQEKAGPTPCSTSTWSLIPLNKRAWGQRGARAAPQGPRRRSDGHARGRPYLWTQNCVEEDRGEDFCQSSRGEAVGAPVWTPSSHVPALALSGRRLRPRWLISQHG